MTIPQTCLHTGVSSQRPLATIDYRAPVRPYEPNYTWATALRLFLLLIGMIAAIAAFTLIMWAIGDYIFTNVPAPYRDPEPPPGTTTVQ